MNTNPTYYCGYQVVGFTLENLEHYSAWCNLVYTHSVQILLLCDTLFKLYCSLLPKMMHCAKSFVHVTLGVSLCKMHCLLSP